VLGGSVPLEYFEEVISAFVAILGFLWLGVTWRVYMNNERRLSVLEEFTRNETMRNELLISQFKQMLLATELRLALNLESKRASIESTITQQVNEVVEAVKKSNGH
jgi:hypothetical protein